MIRLALILLVFILPAAIVGGLILTIFPHIPSTALVIVTSAIVIGLAYNYVRRRKNYFIREGIPEQAPQWLSKKRYMIFLVIGTLIGSTLIFSFNKTTLYIDNGTDKAITVTLKHEGKITIPANSYVEQIVVLGDNEGTVDGRQVKMDIKDRGKWVWNVNAKNIYVLTSISYSSDMKLYKNGKGGSAGDEDDDHNFDIIKDEFFYTKADYIFKAPESITVKRSRFSSGDVEKTVLYRMKDLADEYGNDDKNMDGKVEVSDPHGEIIEEK